MEQLKALTGVEIKDADQGLIKAVFATLDVVDKDGDVTVKGAFEDGAAVRISAYGHSSWGQALPVGKGVIRASDSDAVLDGKFFMDTSHGRDTFQTIKEMGDLQEFSYGFDVLESDKGEFGEGDEKKDVRFLRSLKVHEVSPVMLGAGVGTRTLAMKVGNSTNTFTTSSTMFGPDGCIPATTTKRAAFSDQAENVLGDVTNLILRAKAFGSQGTDEERKTGRTLSAANRERLAQLMAALGEAGIELEQLLADTDPNKSRDLLIRELMRFEQHRANL